MTFTAPIADIGHALSVSAGLPDLLARDLVGGLDQDTIDAILLAAGKFASERLAPLNSVGDTAPVRLANGTVQLPPGWSEAYHDWCAAGWSQLPGPTEHGGQGLPHVIAMAVSELWNSANLSFGLGPLLTHGAIDALHSAASPELKTRYLPNMVSGRWMGTMNLTEPQAGTDLGHIRAKAEPVGDGTFRISGTKIYITYGDHELTENIIHLVLARLPGAPAGTRGISLFVVPKFLVNADGSLGARNDVRCTGLEHKLGIHAAPTCVMTYGDQGGATGWLVGEAGRGLNAMFVMMNRARLGVGVQGVAIAERATQAALAYARQRKQGRRNDTPTGEMAPIIEHPDVRRMLLTMRASTVAARAICHATARALDLSERAPNPAERSNAADRLALLTPIAKAYATDTAVRVASLGVQVHGGMGFIEATGAAQHYRDARILPIYEGTNGVQAIDLVTRKLPLDGGQAAVKLLAGMRADTKAVAVSGLAGAERIAAQLTAAQDAVERITGWLAKTLISDPDRGLAAATPYLDLLAATLGGTLVASGVAHAQRGINISNAIAAHWTLAGFHADTAVAAVPGMARGLIDAEPLPGPSSAAL